MLKRLVAFVVATAVAVVGAIQPASAQGALSIIRDTEVESIIRAFGTPLWKAAGLQPSAVRIILVNDRALNAFVAAGQNLFINTGTLIRADNAGQVMGVIAHETGHMAGGHLARMPEAMRNAMIVSMLGMVLGAGAIAAGRSSDGTTGAGPAVMTGGLTLAQRNLFAFTRSQENAADQAGVTYLDAIGQSSRGFLQFMEILARKDALSSIQQDPYLRTHPVTSERVEFLRNQISRSKYSDVPTRPEFEEMHRRVRGKLYAFLEQPGRTLESYPPADTSIEARYARAIALYRVPDLKAALAVIDGLIREFPKDPYFHELRGQMLFEHGKLVEALPSYQTAVNLMPDAPLLRVDLARVQLETNDPKLLNEARDHLNGAARLEPDLPDLWRQLAIAHGRSGDVGMAAMALAEQALLEGRRLDARDQARRAMRLLPQGSPGWLKAQDVESAALRNRE